MYLQYFKLPKAVHLIHPVNLNKTLLTHESLHLIIYKFKIYCFYIFEISFDFYISCLSELMCNIKLKKIHS